LLLDSPAQAAEVAEQWSGLSRGTAARFLFPTAAQTCDLKRVVEHVRALGGAVTAAPRDTHPDAVHRVFCESV
jgi:hypothetical protein